MTIIFWRECWVGWMGVEEALAACRLLSAIGRKKQVLILHQFLWKASQKWGIFGSWKT